MLDFQNSQVNPSPIFTNLNTPNENGIMSTKSSITTSQNIEPFDDQKLIQLVGEQHYNFVSGCLGVLDTIRQDHGPSLAMDPNLTKHLNQQQLNDLKELTLMFVQHITTITDSSSVNMKDSLTISSEEWDSEAFFVFQKMIMEAGRQLNRPKNAELMSRSMLVILVSGFETLMTDLATKILQIRPGISKIEESSITLSELRNLDSVDDARDHLIANVVEDLARGSIEDWAKWFARFDVDLKKVTKDWTGFREIFARRNLIVHTNGKVSSQYLSVMKDVGAKVETLPFKGATLEPTVEYLESSCQLMLAAGALLAASVSMKLFPKSVQVPIHWSLGIAEICLEEKNFKCSLEITRKLSELCKGRSDLILDFRIRRTSWAARTMLGEKESVIEEASAWDIRGIDPLYAHIKSVFEQDYDSALKQINSLTQNGRLQKSSVLTSIVYEPMRRNLGESLFEQLGIRITDIQSTK